jgi:hypothetical protein
VDQPTKALADALRKGVTKGKQQMAEGQKRFQYNRYLKEQQQMGEAPTPYEQWKAQNAS